MQNEVLTQVKEKRLTHGSTPLDNVLFECLDATEHFANGTLAFTHVYMYDKVFHETTSKRLACIFNRSDIRVLVTYQVRTVLNTNRVFRYGTLFTKLTLVPYSQW